MTPGERNGLSERRVHDATERAIKLVSRSVWFDNDLSAAEARLVWLKTAIQMLDSTMIDIMRPVVAESLGLVKPETNRPPGT